MSRATLRFFFCLHFILPFFIFGVVVVHVICLHSYGSTSVLGYSGEVGKVPLFPFYYIKDAGVLCWFMGFLGVLLYFPWTLGDPGMFVESNPFQRPAHIVPEWYFLPFYAILRCCPDKTSGVVLILLSILGLVFLVFVCFLETPVLSVVDNILMRRLFFILLVLG